MHVAIVGGGIAGLATGWALARDGHAVTLIDQAAAIPNPLGASGDQHRIIRRGYGTADGYATLLTDAFDAWEALWADLGQRHYVPTGVLSMCQRPGDEADDIHQGYARMGIAHERLSPREAAARFPFLDAGGFREAALTPEGGALLCQRIAAGLLEFLQAHGATVRAGTQAVAVEPDGRVLLTGGETLRADRVVVAAGGWTPVLLPALAAALTTLRTHVAYVQPPADLAQPWAQAPVILSVGGDSEAWAIPPVAGTGLKFGSGLLRHPAGPDDDEPGTTRIGERLVAAMAPVLGRLHEYRVSSLRSCVYTFTADERFFAHQQGAVLAVSACSGHGYKFGAAVGRRVAAAVLSGDTAGLRRWLRADALADA
jgi:sarcosine oxidase